MLVLLRLSIFSQYTRSTWSSLDRSITDVVYQGTRVSVAPKVELPTFLALGRLHSFGSQPELHPASHHHAVLTELEVILYVFSFFNDCLGHCGIPWLSSFRLHLLSLFRTRDLLLVWPVISFELAPSVAFRLSVVSLGDRAIASIR